MTDDPAMTDGTTTTDGTLMPPEGYMEYSGEPLTVKELQGATVYSNANESISDISDFVLDGEGKITDVIIDVGGFLGMGTRSVAVPYDQLEIYMNENRDMRVYLPMSAEQLEAMPEHVI